MSAVDTLRAKAARLAEQLTQAQAKAQAEAQAVAARNQERRSAFWQGVLVDTVPAVRRAVDDAQGAFSDAVANGGDVAGAYVHYCRAHAVAQDVVRQTAWELATYHHDLTGEPNAPGDRTGTVRYPDSAQPTNDDPETFVGMLAKATADHAETHARAFLADLQAPLVAALEPEDAD